MEIWPLSCLLDVDMLLILGVYDLFLSGGLVDVMFLWCCLFGFVVTVSGVVGA